jgi:chitodextrinase
MQLQFGNSYYDAADDFEKDGMFKKSKYWTELEEEDEYIESEYFEGNEEQGYDYVDDDGDRDESADAARHAGSGTSANSIDSSSMLDEL